MINLLNNFIHWLLLPSLVLLLLMLWQRRVFSAVCLAVNSLAFFILFGGLFIPDSAATPPDSIPLRVMTYNIASYMTTPDQMVAAIKSAEADLVSLQEVGDAHAAAFQTQLSEVYPYQVSFPEPENVTDNALLSRYRILNYEVFFLYTTNPYIQAEVEIQGQVVQVIVFHPPIPNFSLSLRPSYHDHHLLDEEIAGLVARFSPDQPTLLLGDFNMTDQNANYQTIAAAGFTDVFRQVGWGFGATFPANQMMPLIRIDYVWTSAHFIPLSASVGQDGGSDHLPLIVEIALK